MKISCPHCSQHLEGDDSLAGATVECPKCGNVFTIPEPEPLPLRVLPTDNAVLEKPKSQKKGKRIAFRIAGGLIGLLVILRLINFLTEEVGQHPEDASAPAVLAAEQDLLADYEQRNGTEDLQGFLEFWNGLRTYSLETYVPWAFLKSREREIQYRIQHLKKNFRREEETFRMLQELKPDSEAKQRQDAAQDFGTISKYLFNSEELVAYFHRDSGPLTSLQRQEFEDKLPQKLRQSSLRIRSFDENLLFHPIPDGTVFSVDSISVPDKDDVYVRVGVSIVPAEDGFKMWEFRRADLISDMSPSPKQQSPQSFVRRSNNATLGNPDGVDWDSAPWKHQTEEWIAEMKLRCFPGRRWDPHSLLSLRLYRTPEVEQRVSGWTTYMVNEKLGDHRTLHVGTFLVSRGWMVGLILPPNGVKGLSPSYVLFASEDEILAFARGSRSFRPTPMEVIGPREKSDITLRDQEMDKEIRDYPSWKRLYPPLDLPASAKKDRDFQRYSLDEDVALEFQSIKKWQGNKLQKEHLFRALWNNADPKASPNNDPSLRSSFVAFPDDVSFSVVDVEEKKGMYDVSLVPIAQSDEDLPVAAQGVISHEDFLRYIDSRYRIYHRVACHVLFPKKHRSIQYWAKGTVVKSNGWVLRADLSMSYDSKYKESQKAISIDIGRLYPSVSAYRQYLQTLR